MDSFSYIDNIRAAFASCLPCFTSSPRSESASSSTPNPSSNAEPRSASTRSSSSNDLEHLLRDSDSDALSLHSNLGAAAQRRARHRRRVKFSITLFGYTLFGRPPIYLSDDDDGDDSSGRTARALVTASSSTLDSDPATLDASTIERLTSPDHIAALAAQRESERQQLEAEEARRKAERRARRQERKARARAEALGSLNGASHRPDVDTFEGFQGSGSETVPTSFRFHPVEVVPDHPRPEGLSRDGDFDGSITSYSGDADDADLGGELYTRNKKKLSAVLSASGSDSRSRTSASFSAGDASHIQNFPVHSTHQSIPYPHAEMHVPTPAKKKSHRASKRTSVVSSATSQSTSTAPYTPVESITETPAVAAFPVPQERYIHDGKHADFPSVGLSGKRSPKSLDPRAFMAHQG
ncbi:hypothetical protein J3R82DRAFT_6374 [Butyriboletus roseoflavus]|nr:hypothetical protein J3R82DRAFT_6374 [Butyriboletus roseoflavus]